MSLRLLAPCEYEETIRRSRFIAQAAPISSEADTLAFHETVADLAATHNCWAWRLDGRHRHNDDGEPGGTAGRPILAVLEGRDLDGVMVVVTRYYGGIKLGAGGLVRAYGGTAAKCLDRGQTEPRIQMLRCELTADFALSGLVHQLLERHDGQKQDEQFGARGLTFTVMVPKTAVEALRRDLESASRGQAKLWVSR
ncbi:MAG: YigZ family protein [Pseudomonadota bacterium]